MRQALLETAIAVSGEFSSLLRWSVGGIGRATEERFRNEPWVVLAKFRFASDSKIPSLDWYPCHLPSWSHLLGC